MMAYHSSYVILVDPFKTRKYQHIIAAYNSIMQSLKNRGPSIDLQIIDNGASQNYKAAIKDKWGVYFQLSPPDIHRRNASEQAIRTFKADFIAVLSGVAPGFPQFLWDILIVQTEMKLNLLCQ